MGIGGKLRKVSERKSSSGSKSTSSRDTSRLKIIRRGEQAEQTEQATQPAQSQPIPPQYKSSAARIAQARVAQSKITPATDTRPATQAAIIRRDPRSYWQGKQSLGDQIKEVGASQAIAERSKAFGATHIPSITKVRESPTLQKVRSSIIKRDTQQMQEAYPRVAEQARLGSEFLKGGYSYIREKPFQAGTNVVIGAAAAPVLGGVAATGKAASIGVKAAGVGLTAAYGIGVQKQISREKTPEGKARVIGGATAEVGSFVAGGLAGSRAFRKVDTRSKSDIEFDKELTRLRSEATPSKLRTAKENILFDVELAKGRVLQKAGIKQKSKSDIEFDAELARLRRGKVEGKLKSIKESIVFDAELAKGKAIKTFKPIKENILFDVELAKGKFAKSIKPKTAIKKSPSDIEFDKELARLRQQKTLKEDIEFDRELARLRQQKATQTAKPISKSFPQQAAQQTIQIQKPTLKTAQKPKQIYRSAQEKTLYEKSLYKGGVVYGYEQEMYQPVVRGAQDMGVNPEIIQSQKLSISPKFISNIGLTTPQLFKSGIKSMSSQISYTPQKLKQSLMSINKEILKQEVKPTIKPEIKMKLPPAYKFKTPALEGYSLPPMPVLPLWGSVDGGGMDRYKSNKGRIYSTELNPVASFSSMIGVTLPKKKTAKKAVKNQTKKSKKGKKAKRK